MGNGAFLLITHGHLVFIPFIGTHKHRDYRNNHGNIMFVTSLWCTICHRGPLLALVIYYFQALTYELGLLTCEQFDR